MTPVTRKLVLTAGLLSLAGCRLLTEIGEGGELDSASGAHDCSQFSTCAIEITAADFDETFTAVARPGYVFSHWKGGEKYQCPGSASPVCEVSNTLFAGNAQAEAVIASGAEYYLEPVFKALRVPTPVVVDAAGKIIGVPAEKTNTDFQRTEQMALWITFDGLEGAHLVSLDSYKQEINQHDRDVLAFREASSCGAFFRLISSLSGELELLPAYPVAVNPCGIFAVDYSAGLVEFSAYEYWDALFGWKVIDGNIYLGYPMVPVEIDIAWPVRVELR